MLSAHKVTKIEYDKDIAFNLSSEEEISELIEPYLDTLDNDGCGYVEIFTDTLEDLLKEAEKEETKEQLRQMIKESEDDGYIAFYIF